MPAISVAFRRLSRYAVLALLVISLAVADTTKISPDLLPLLSNPANNVNVIVQYNAPVQQTCSGGGLLNLGGLVCSVVGVVNGLVKVVFTLLNAVAMTLNAGDVINLSNQSNVNYISLDRTVAGSLDYTTAAVNAPYAWSSGLDGSGVGVAIIDSGIYSHPDLNTRSGWGSRVVYRQSFIGGSKYDDFGHGTHVAGIVGGNGATSSKPGSFRLLKGIAPNANLLDLRVLDQNGASNDSVVIAAIEKAVKLKSQYNIRVINLSLGRPIYESCTKDPLCQAVEAAWGSGIVVVTAAGNLGRNGYATVLSPGNSPHAITVGAMKTEATMNTSDDLIASYSSRGPTYIDLTAKPDVVAPGNLVVSLLAPGSTLANEFPANVIAPSYYTTSTYGNSPAYFRLSGTSMATPVVSGAVALMLQKDPTLNPDTIKARIMKTAGKTFPLTSVAVDPTTGIAYADAYDMFTIGAGYLNIQAALQNYDRAYGSAASPQVTYNSLQQMAYLTANPSLIWWSSPVWSTAASWGTTVLLPGPSGSAAVWGSAASWGTAASWGSAASWGTAASWGSAASWGTAASLGTSTQGEK